MNLVDRIREYYASIIDNKIRKIEGLPTEYPAYVFKFNNEYGVCIPFENTTDFSENFNNSRIRTLDVHFEGTNQRVLFFSSKSFNLREQFAVISTYFVDPGIDGFSRKQLIKDPEKWVMSWIDLLGNAKKNKKYYSVLGELYALNRLFSIDKMIIWTGAAAGTHDLESSLSCFEVKSTILKYDTYVTISSQNQLYSDKQIFLVFVRLEKSPYGVSINSVVKEIIDKGYDSKNLEVGLSKHGLYFTKRQRNEKFNVLECRIFKIDDEFPKMDLNNLINIVNKEHIIKITYTIDLTGLNFVDIDRFEQKL
jgi:hypothetical protein